MTFLEQFKAARRAGTPIIAVNTPDPAECMRRIATSMNGNCPGIITWDVVRGIRGFNPSGEEIVKTKIQDPELKTNPYEALPLLEQATPDRTLVFMLQAHRYASEPPVAQAIWNLRDTFKVTARSLIMLCPGITLPAELAQDVVVIDEPLPGREELGDIVTSIYKWIEQTPSQPVLEKAVDALSGLAAFSAEQATAMSMNQAGLDLSELWERKRTMVEQTPGLSIYRGREKFSDIGGCKNIKTFLGRILNGGDPPRAIVFQDEIEKAFAGAGTDLSGTSTEMLGTILSYMQDTEAQGVVFIGHPGAAKSAIGKAVGNEAGIPTVVFDMGAMKGSLVGQSNEQLRNALKTIRAISDGKALFVATCNSWGQIPPELKRRYTLGTFFFDLPDTEEREAIWKIYLKKYSVADERPDHEGWTGAEIKNCCSLAWRLSITPKEAAKYIVPLCRSNAAKIEELRRQANGNFISASQEGTYTYGTSSNTASTGRKIEFA